jgi:hypothetical protein
LQKDLEPEVLRHAIEKIVPEHLREVRKRKEEIVTRTIAAVKDRLTKEINYWDFRANELKAQELTGKVNAKLNSGKARQRADEMQVRLRRRLDDLEKERHITAAPPLVIGGALVVPVGLLARLRGERSKEPDTFARETARIEQLAMDAVMAAETRLGFYPKDVHTENRGYDIESLIPGQGLLRFIEVKGRAAGASTVTVTKNEILTGLNKPEEFILAIVEIDGESATPRYIRGPFQREPDFGVTSVNYEIKELLARAEAPL